MKTTRKNCFSANSSAGIVRSKNNADRLLFINSPRNNNAKKDGGNMDHCEP